MPYKAFAAGGFGVASSSVKMYPGETKTIKISSNNAVGKLNISSSNKGVATVSPGSIFIQNPGSNGSITITSNSVGTATISVVASDNFATMDEEILAGQKKTITVNVVARPTPKPETPKPQLSKNNNIKSLSVEGYKIEKVADNNYTLTVANDVAKVNVSAIAEDSKTKITGTGVKELKVGENNITVVVTAESGAQRKINIKVTRKDGYYLEDLDSVLKNDKIQVADIRINADSKITKEQLEQVKNSKKMLRLNYYDANKKLVYSWLLNGKEIKNIKEFITTISFGAKDAKEVYKLSNYADGVYINFKHSGDLPKGTKVKLFVGDKFEDNSSLNAYRYNNTDKKLDLIKDKLKVVDGYIELEIGDCSQQLLTMSTIGEFENASTPSDTNNTNTANNNIFVLFTIIELIIIIGLVAFIFIKLRLLKKDKNVVIPNTNSNEFDNNNNNNHNSNSNSNSNNIYSNNSHDGGNNNSF